MEQQYIAALQSRCGSCVVSDAIATLQQLCSV